MRIPFVPTSFKPPQRVDLSDEYYVVPITTKNVDEDWKIITTNADAICMIRGGGSRSGWPYIPILLRFAARKSEKADSPR